MFFFGTFPLCIEAFCGKIANWDDLAILVAAHHINHEPEPVFEGNRSKVDFR